MRNQTHAPLVYRESQLGGNAYSPEHAWLGQNITELAPFLRIATAHCSHLIPFAEIKPIDGTNRNIQAKYDAVAQEPCPENLLFPSVKGNKTYDFLLTHNHLYADKLIPKTWLEHNNDKKLLEKLPNPDTADFLYLLRQVFDGINTLHNIWYLDTEKNIQKRTLIHHDLGLHNLAIRYSSNGNAHVYVYDYELAREENSAMPQTITPMGHEAYAPLEQYEKGIPAKITEDIFALGFLVHDLFIARNMQTFDKEIYYRKAYEFTDADWEKFAEKFSTEIAVVLQKATAKKAEERYPTTEIFWMHLEEAWAKTYPQDYAAVPMFSAEAQRMFLERYKKRISI